MNLINKHLNKSNLHHAYLVEGARDEVISQILDFVNTMDIPIVGNPDFCHITLDTFKIDDARNLKSIATEKGFTKNKKIFLISSNSFLLEAQNALLKIFEEPIENTHFFINVPNIDSLLPTLISRFYLIKLKENESQNLEDALKFAKMSLKERLDFIKDLLVENDGDDENFQESARTKAVRFLNSLEFVLKNKNKLQDEAYLKCFKHFFKVREFLRQPGSAPKMLLESVAMIVPCS